MQRKGGGGVGLKFFFSWLQLQATACFCLLCMQMTIRFVTSSCFFMSNTIWHMITVSEEKTSDGQRLISRLMMYKNNHFTPLWHTYADGYEAGSACARICQCPVSVTALPDFISHPCCSSSEMLAAQIKASLSAWHAYMQKVQKASFVQ